MKANKTIYRGVPFVSFKHNCDEIPDKKSIWIFSDVTGDWYLGVGDTEYHKTRETGTPDYFEIKINNCPFCGDY